MLCAVCKSDKNVEFLTITDCYLCGKCQDELSEAFDQAMTMDRDDYPELYISRINCVVPYFLIISKSAETLWKRIEEAEKNHRTSQLILFIN